MPNLNGTGPEGKGSSKGRELGLCQNAPVNEVLNKLGRGLGKKRKSGGGKGKGKRLRSGF